MTKFFPYYIYIIFFISHIFIGTREYPEEQVTQLPIGNFALPTSQQPGPLFSFGQNIVDKNNFQIFLSGDSFVGDRKNYSDIMPSILYGVSDNFSIFINVPFAVHLRLNDEKSSGIGDITVQAEYAFYGHDTLSTGADATIVLNIGFPTGSASKAPPTGFGGTTIFAGGTLSYSTFDWYLFTCQGVLLTTSHKQTKFGNQVFYQFGVERCVNFFHGWITAFFLELFGIYSQRSIFQNTLDLNSGSNIFHAAPSVWFSSEHFTFQAGFAVPIFQKLRGIQNRNYFTAAINFGWKI
ncbi:MAG TPA: hypothetical protein VEK38_03135 [Candidatus Bathyarchaeia archaeon]|nr:hypothetical protein [Candidatus Bathyarchaeia archaeon]